MPGEHQVHLNFADTDLAMREDYAMINQELTQELDTVLDKIMQTAAENLEQFKVDNDMCWMFCITALVFVQLI